MWNSSLAKFAGSRLLLLQANLGHYQWLCALMCYVFQSFWAKPVMGFSVVLFFKLSAPWFSFRETAPAVTKIQDTHANLQQESRITLLKLAILKSQIEQAMNKYHSFSQG